MQEIKIPARERVLSGNLFPAPEGGVVKKPAALLLHGWQSSQIRMFSTAEMLSSRSGMTCLTVDLRAHGKSEGVLGGFSSKDFLDDVLAAYDFLAAQPNVDSSRIGVIGTSFGGYLAALLSSKRNVAWIVLHVPADYPDETFNTPKIPISIQDRLKVDEWRQQ
jgi:hypothetical protein